MLLLVLLSNKSRKKHCFEIIWCANIETQHSSDTIQQSKTDTLSTSRPILRALVYYTYEVTAPMLRQKYYSDPNGHANNWIRISKISGIIAIKSVLSRKVARKAVAANMLFLTSVSVILIHPIIFLFLYPLYLHLHVCLN